jgi:hypothetical protein
MSEELRLETLKQLKEAKARLLEKKHKVPAELNRKIFQYLHKSVQPRSIEKETRDIEISMMLEHSEPKWDGATASYVDSNGRTYSKEATILINEENDKKRKEIGLGVPHRPNIDVIIKDSPLTEESRQKISQSSVVITNPELAVTLFMEQRKEDQLDKIKREINENQYSGINSIFTRNKLKEGEYLKKFDLINLKKEERKNEND